MLQRKDLILKENNPHGDFLFPIMHYNCNLPQDFSHLPIHWHEQMEFTIIRSGTATYNINLKSYTIKEGDILLISPFLLHDINLNNSPSMASDSFVFSLDLLDIKSSDCCSLKYLTPIHDGLCEFEPVISPSHKSYTKLVHLFDELYTTYINKGIGYELIVKSILFRLISTMFSDGITTTSNISTSNNIHIDKLKIVLQYIHNNLSTKLTAHNLAKLCGYSEYHFMRFFKKYTGMTCTEYINFQRLDLATMYLRNSNMNIMEISLEVGFDNISYFNRRFKDTYNVTPKEYRKLISKHSLT